MYGGKHVAEGDTIFVFASENEGGQTSIVQGVSHCDRNLFNGDADALHRFWGGGA